MKISYNWLREYVQTDLSAKELAERLTRVGLAVDAVHPQGDDFLLDFDLTTNRPDAMSHVGMAREAAVVSGSRVSAPDASLVDLNDHINGSVKIVIEAGALCHRYAGRLIRGVKIGPSPDWLVKRLESVGQRSINNVVDVTNFVLQELGHPLHAFDYDTLKDRKIVVRLPKPGEKLTTLDGVERTLTPDMLMICDGERPVAVAGVMGGADTEISESSVNVFLESAWFAPTSVRQTARALALNTEASKRFERGADFEAVRYALDRCAKLIVEVAGGEIVSGVADVIATPRETKRISIRHSRIAQLTAVEVPQTTASEILFGLGCELVVEDDGFSEWIAPSWRVDVNIEEDLVEEIIRHVGYDAIPATLPTWGGAGEYLAGENRRRAIRQTLVGAGFYEAISFSWAAESTLAMVGAPAGIVIQNPIDQNEDRVRTSLQPGILRAVANNFRFGTTDVRLFEFGNVFEGDTENLRERERLALVVAGTPEGDDWRGPGRRESFHTLKGVLETVFGELKVQGVEIDAPGDAIGFFPGQVADVRLDGRFLGRFGRVSAEIAEEFRFKQPVYVAELDLAPLLDQAQVFEPYRPLPEFPAVERDISAMLDSMVMFGAIRKAFEALAIPELVDVRLREVFTGKQIPEGKRALTLNLCYRADRRTLTDEEVAAQHARVLETLRNDLGAVIR